MTTTFRSDQTRKRYACRLAEDDVRLVRLLHAEGLSHRAIARKFEVGKTTVEAILTGRTWRHIE
jgi:transposase